MANAMHPKCKGCNSLALQAIVWVGFHISIFVHYFKSFLIIVLGVFKWEGDPFTHHSIFLILIGDPLLWWVTHPTFLIPTTLRDWHMAKIEN